MVDNSRSMLEEQRNVARNLPGLVAAIETLADANGNLRELDVHLMVTTADRGAPLCPGPAGYEPTGGSPTTTGCNARGVEFDDPSVCAEVCPVDVDPAGQFIAFGPDGDNLGGAAPRDVDGDGVPESAAAQAVACLGAPGSVGCEYGSPLEAMLQALNPSAEWNTGPDPFLRRDAGLMVILIGDAPDCSIENYAIISNTTLMNVDPATGEPAPSPALCWNAGVSCKGPDARGVYDGCASTTGGSLFDVDRYVEYLRDGLQAQQRKPVLVGVVAGVPLVTRHQPEPPFEPVAGGVFDLVIRDWRDPAYPAGDILPDDWAAGLDAATQQFRHGIGPGCTGAEGGEFIGQALPPVRIREVCEAVAGERRGCCIESICDPDFSAVMKCLYAAWDSECALLSC